MSILAALAIMIGPALIIAGEPGVGFGITVFALVYFYGGRRI